MSVLTSIKKSYLNLSTAFETSPQLAEKYIQTKSLALRDAIDTIELKASKLATTFLAGKHNQRRKGHGEEFWQFRPFITGEHARLIDWRRSARENDKRRNISEQHFYIREYEWQSAQKVHIALDLSPSMQYCLSQNALTKRDHSLILACAMILILQKSGENIRLMGKDFKTLNKQGTIKIEEVLHFLSDLEGKFFYDDKMRKGDKILIFSDFLQETEEYKKLLQTAKSKQVNIYGLQIIDPLERDFPFKGDHLFIDPETKETIKIGKAHHLQKQYKKSFENFSTQLADIFKTYQATLMHYETDTPSLSFLFALHQTLEQ